MKKRLGIVLSVAISLSFFGCGRTVQTETPEKSPRESYSLQWVSNDAPSTMAPGASVVIHVTARNTGSWPWPDPRAANPAKPDGSFAVALFYAWSGSPKKRVPANSARGELARSVAPGETGDFTITVEAPKETGSYKLEFDLVEELVTFFSTKGSERLVIPVTVQ